MCCRYYMEGSTIERIADGVKQSPLTDRFLRAGYPLITEGEIFPSSVVPAFALNKQGNICVFPMKWGFNVSGADMIINARAETAAENKLFRDSWMSHRCVLPASYYFEWTHEARPNGRRIPTQKYAIQPRGETVTWICGLYRIEKGFPHFVIVTLPPSDSVSFIHDRMPMILSKRLISRWLCPAEDAAVLAKECVRELVSEPLESYYSQPASAGTG